jgi:hypothetical protein
MRLDSDTFTLVSGFDAHPKNSTIIRANNRPGLFFFIKFSGDNSWLFVVRLLQKKSFPLENPN